MLDTSCGHSHGIEVACSCGQIFFTDIAHYQSCALLQYRHCLSISDATGIFETFGVMLRSHRHQNVADAKSTSENLAVAKVLLLL